MLMGDQHEGKARVDHRNRKHSSNVRGDSLWHRLRRVAKRQRIIWACATCGRSPMRHTMNCLCQDFDWLYINDMMRVSPSDRAELGLT
jgi:hypothetical protein